MSRQSYDLETVVDGAKYKLQATGLNVEKSDFSAEVGKKATLPIALAKGDLITLDLQNLGTPAHYRILKINETIAEILAMEDLADNGQINVRQIFSDNEATITFTDGREGAQYANSALDIYLNSTWYNTLSTSAKKAIVTVTLKQTMYGLNEPADSYYTQNEYGGDEEDIEKLYIYGSANIGLRNIYVLGIEDIVKYIDNSEINCPSNDLSNMFFMTGSWPEFQLLRDAGSDYASQTWVISFSPQGNVIGTTIADGSGHIRPAMTIDLSKISYTKV